MATTVNRPAFIKTRAFKVLVLFVYVYSFIQLDADDTPITIEIDQVSEPAQIQTIRVQLERPFKLMIKLFGKEQQETD